MPNHYADSLRLCAMLAQLSLASFPPPSLQKYLSRYGLLEPTGALSYHHAVFPVPPLPSILTPPLLRRMSIATQSQAKKSKPRHLLNEVIDPIGGMGSERHVRAGTLDAPNGNASAAAAGAAGTSASGSGSGRNTPMMRLNEHGVEEDAMTGSATPYDITAALESTSTSLLSSSSTSSRRRKRTWHEPKTNEFANLTAYDSPAVVVERLAKKAKLHWDMRDSVKEGETLTNFIFALRMRGMSIAVLVFREIDLDR